MRRVSVRMENTALVETLDYGVDPKCPVCQSEVRVSDQETGELICGVCGLVLDQDKINGGPEWRAFDLQEKSTRARVETFGSSAMRDQYYTNLYGFSDGSGRKLSLDAIKKMQRLNRVNNVANNDETVRRNLKIASKSMSMLTEKLGLPRGINDDAFKLYRRALDRDLIRGKTIEGFIAASLLVVIRERGIARSLLEIASALDVDQRVVARLYRELLTEFNLRMPIDEPRKYFEKLCGKMEVEPEVHVRAQNLLKLAKTQGLIQGKRPNGVAAAALYLALRESFVGVTQKCIARLAETSEVTLRIRVNDLKCLDVG
jgi:transcription initiation factor TFIIB